MPELKKHIPINSAVFIFKFEDAYSLIDCLSNEEFQRNQAEIINIAMTEGAEVKIFTHPRTPKFDSDIINNRFENMTLNEIVGDMWFGDDDPHDYTFKSYEEYILNFNCTFPEAKLNSEEIKYLLKLNPNK